MDSQNDVAPAEQRERPFLLIFLGWIGILGCAALILGTFVAPVFVPDYDWIADTISDLAAGENKWIMDFALYGFAAGLLAVALAAAHAHPGGPWWSVGVIALAMLALLVTIIGARDEYGDGDTGGVVIHIYLVYALGALFLFTALAMAPGIGRFATWARWGLVALGIAWAIMSPIFLMSPNGIDGLLERVLGLIAVAMVATLSWVFIGRGRAQ